MEISSKIPDFLGKSRRLGYFSRKVGDLDAGRSRKQKISDFLGKSRRLGISAEKSGIWMQADRENQRSPTFLGQDFAQWLLAEPIDLTQFNRSKNLVVYLNYFFAIGCGEKSRYWWQTAD